MVFFYCCCGFTRPSGNRICPQSVKRRYYRGSRWGRRGGSNIRILSTRSSVVSPPPAPTNTHLTPSLCHLPTRFLLVPTLYSFIYGLVNRIPYFNPRRKPDCFLDLIKNLLIISFDASSLDIVFPLYGKWLKNITFFLFVGSLKIIKRRVS